MTITVELPDDIGHHPDSGREALEALAIQGYRTEALTLRQVAATLGMYWYDFEDLLKERGVEEGSLTVKDFERDIATLDRLRAEGILK